MANEKIEIGVKVDIAQAQADLDELAETIRQLNESGDDNEEVVKRLTKQWDKQNAALGRAKKAMEATANAEKKVGKGIEDVGKSADASKDAMDALTSVLSLAGLKSNGLFGILSRGKVAFDAIKKAVDAFKKSQLAANATMDAGAKSAKVLGNSLKALGKATVISAGIGLAFEGISKLIDKISSKTTVYLNSLDKAANDAVEAYNKLTRESERNIDILNTQGADYLIINTKEINNLAKEYNVLERDIIPAVSKAASDAYKEYDKLIKNPPVINGLEKIDEAYEIYKKINKVYDELRQKQDQTEINYNRLHDERIEYHLTRAKYEAENDYNKKALSTVNLKKEELRIEEKRYALEYNSARARKATDSDLLKIEERHKINLDEINEKYRIKDVNDYYDKRVALRNSQLTELGKTIDELQGRLDDLASSEISTDEEVAIAKKGVVTALKEELELNSKLAEIDYLRIKNTSKDPAEIEVAKMTYETKLKALQYEFEKKVEEINSVLSGEEIALQNKIDEVLGYINEMEKELNANENEKKYFLPPIELNKKLYEDEVIEFKEHLNDKLISKAQYDDAMRLLDLKYHRDWKSLTLEEKDFYINSMLEMADATSSIFDSIGDMQDTNTRAGFNRQKKMQAASTIVNTLSGVVAAISAAQSIPPPYGQIVGAANAASVMAAGIANLKQINATKFGQNSMSSNIDVKSSSDKINETIIQRSIGVSEQDNTKVVLVLSDIEAKQQSINRVTVNSEV